MMLLLAQVLAEAEIEEVQPQSVNEGTPLPTALSGT